MLYRVYYRDDKSIVHLVYECDADEWKTAEEKVLKIHPEYRDKLLTTFAKD